MKQCIIGIIFAAMGALGAASQAVTIDEIARTPGKAGGVYYAYPVTESANTPAPKGYKPFHINHYGRHGSRYLISDRDYSDVRAQLHRADSAGALTPLGLCVLARVDSIWEEARGMGGELSPLGNRQHRAIAGRMHDAFPEVFAPGARMKASSTVIMRCAHSMFSFIEGLKNKAPWLEIPRQSGNRDMGMLNYHSQASNRLTSDSGPWYAPYKRFRAERTRPDRMIKALFADSTYAATWVDAPEFMWQMYWLAVDMQNMETPVTFFDIFTTEELYNLWQVFNFQFFSRNSSYAPARGEFTANARGIVADMVAEADSTIAAGAHGARLRFGHDGNLVPLVALLRIPGAYSGITDPNQLYQEWADFKICPMAANLQIVLFRHTDPAKPVLAKVMLNEREVALPVETASAPFYRWTDLREYLLSL